MRTVITIPGRTLPPLGDRPVAYAGVKRRLRGKQPQRLAASIVAARRQDRAAKDGIPQIYYLEHKRVSATTRTHYLKHHKLVKAFGLSMKPQVSLSVDNADLVLRHYLADLFFEKGQGIFNARMAVFGTAFVLQMPPRSETTLPQAKEILKGWKKAVANYSRSPSHRK